MASRCDRLQLVPKGLRCPECEALPGVVQVAGTLMPAPTDADLDRCSSVQSWNWRCPACGADLELSMSRSVSVSGLGEPRPLTEYEITQARITVATGVRSIDEMRRLSGEQEAG
jgi:hypothetical protein